MKRNQKQQIPDWYCQCQQQHGCSSPIVASCFVCLTKYHCVTNLLFILRPLNLQCMYVCMHLRMQAYAHIYDANSQRKFNRRMNKKLEFQGFIKWLWTNTGVFGNTSKPHSTGKFGFPREKNKSYVRETFLFNANCYSPNSYTHTTLLNICEHYVSICPYLWCKGNLIKGINTNLNFKASLNAMKASLLFFLIICLHVR